MNEGQVIEDIAQIQYRGEVGQIKKELSILDEEGYEKGRDNTDDNNFYDIRFDRGFCD